MPQPLSTFDDLDQWVAAHNPDAALSYGKGWWDGIEFIRQLRDQHGLETIEVPATYLMETPPPSEMLLMPVYRIQHRGLECYIRTDFGPLPPYWFLSIRTSERLPHIYGLFDPARDWRQTSRYLEGFREEWRYPPFSENPLCFTCAVDSEMDVYMLIRLLIGTPGAGSIHNDPLLRRQSTPARVWRVVFHIPALPKMHVMWVIRGRRAREKRGMFTTILRIS